MTTGAIHFPGGEVLVRDIDGDPRTMGQEIVRSLTATLGPDYYLRQQRIETPNGYKWTYRALSEHEKRLEGAFDFHYYLFGIQTELVMVGQRGHRHPIFVGTPAEFKTFVDAWRPATPASATSTLPVAPRVSHIREVVDGRLRPAITIASQRHRNHTAIGVAIVGLTEESPSYAVGAAIAMARTQCGSTEPHMTAVPTELGVTRTPLAFMVRNDAPIKMLIKALRIVETNAMEGLVYLRDEVCNELVLFYEQYAAR